MYSGKTIEELKEISNSFCQESLKFQARATSAVENGIANDNIPNGLDYCQKNTNYFAKRAGYVQCEILKLERLNQAFDERVEEASQSMLD